jgi:hypothetical protein
VDLKGMDCEDVDLFLMAEDRDQWPAAVNMVMIFGIPYEEGNFLVS